MPLLDDEPGHHLVDRALRQALQDPENLRDLLSFVVPDLVSGFDFAPTKVLPPEFILDDWRGRESDLLAEIPYRTGGEEVAALVCLVLEHQSQSDPRMPLRVLTYGVNYWDRKWREWEERKPPRPKFDLPPLLSVVFYTGSGTWGSNRSVADLLGEPKLFRRFAPKWEPIFWECGAGRPSR